MLQMTPPELAENGPAEHERLVGPNKPLPTANHPALGGRVVSVVPGSVHHGCLSDRVGDRVFGEIGAVTPVPGNLAIDHREGSQSAHPQVQVPVRQELHGRIEAADRFDRGSPVKPHSRRPNRPVQGNVRECGILAGWQRGESKTALRAAGSLKSGMNTGALQPWPVRQVTTP